MASKKKKPVQTICKKNRTTSKKGEKPARTICENNSNALQKSIFDIIIAIIQILSLVAVFLTLVEMRAERTMQYQPNIVFSPAYFSIHYRDDLPYDEEHVNDYLEEYLHNESGLKGNPCIVFDSDFELHGDSISRYGLAAYMTNIGAGNATEITVQLSHSDIVNALEEMKNEIGGMELEYNDYASDPNAVIDLVTDDIKYSDGSYSFNSIWSSVDWGESISYLLAEHENSCYLYLPEIYYSFIYETMLRYDYCGANIYSPYHIPSLPITISYKDVQGNVYTQEYSIDTKMGYCRDEAVGIITINKK